MQKLWVQHLNLCCTLWRSDFFVAFFLRFGLPFYGKPFYFVFDKKSKARSILCTSLFTLSVLWFFDYQY